MTALRGVAARVAGLRQDLGEREETVLGSLQELRLLTTNQIQRLHVSDGSATTQGRRTRALLRRLSDLGLVVRLERQVGGHQAGSRVAAFCLSGLGQAVVTRPQLGPRRRTVWRRRPYFLAHMLAVAELYVRTVETCRRNGSELLRFDGEPRTWRSFSGAGGELVRLKPDAHVRTGIGECELTSFVEMDMGTESLPTVQRKCQTFLSYWRTGLEQQTAGVFPRVVWLVPDERRLEGIARAVRRLAQREAHDLFTVALQRHGPAILTTLPEVGGGRP